MANKQVDELNKIQKKNNNISRLVEMKDDELIKTLLNPEQYAFFVLYERLQERTIKRLLQFIELVETKRMAEIQALANALAEQMKGEQKSELRQKIDDILYLVNAVLPFFMKQKPKLEVK